MDHSLVMDRAQPLHGITRRGCRVRCRRDGVAPVSDGISAGCDRSLSGFLLLRTKPRNSRSCPASPPEIKSAAPEGLRQRLRIAPGQRRWSHGCEVVPDESFTSEALVEAFNEAILPRTAAESGRNNSLGRYVLTMPSILVQSNDEEDASPTDDGIVGRWDFELQCERPCFGNREEPLTLTLILRNDYIFGGKRCWRHHRRFPGLDIGDPVASVRNDHGFPDPGQPDSAGFESDARRLGRKHHHHPTVNLHSGQFRKHQQFNDLFSNRD